MDMSVGNTLPYRATSYPIRSYNTLKNSLNTIQTTRRVNLSRMQSAELANTTGVIPRLTTRYDQMIERMANRRLETIENSQLRKVSRADLKAYHTIQMANFFQVKENRNLVDLLA
jgi:hypothetical protein